MGAQASKQENDSLGGFGLEDDTAEPISESDSEDENDKLLSYNVPQDDKYLRQFAQLFAQITTTMSSDVKSPPAFIFDYQMISESQILLAKDLEFLDQLSERRKSKAKSQFLIPENILIKEGELMLSRSPQLKHLRQQWVPARLSENAFWEEIFIWLAKKLNKRSLELLPILEQDSQEEIKFS